MPHIDADDVRRTLDRLPRPIGTPLEILFETIRGADRDDIGGEAAKFAYFFFLSLFPLTLIVFALTGLIGGDAAFQRIAAAAETITPDYAWQFVREIIREITDGRRPGALSVGIIVSLWAASNGISALTHGLDRMYDLEGERSWIQRRILALGVFLGGVLLLVLAAAVFVPGWIVQQGLTGPWRYLRWPLAFVLVTALMWLAYRYLPARDQGRVTRETLIGAVVGASMLMLATWGFSVYLSNFSRYGRLYGAIGAVIALLLWFFISGIAVLGGGELARVLELRKEGQRRDDTSSPQSTGATSEASRS